MFTAFTALNHRLGNRLFDKRISHIGKSRITVKTGIMLHFHNAVLNKLSFVFIKLKLVGKIFVSLYELCGTKSRRDRDVSRMILYHVGYRVNAAVYWAV